MLRKLFDVLREDAKDFEVLTEPLLFSYNR